jgi:hypothetical protein
VAFREINELECKQSYQKLKKQKKELRLNFMEKENKAPEQDGTRHQRIRTVERVASKQSLGKLFRK